MTMQFKCDACGAVEEIPQFGAADGASVSNDGNPPKGWRTIFTVIEEHNGKGGISTSTGELLHTCAACNKGLSVDDHFEVDLQTRRAKLAEVR